MTDTSKPDNLTERQQLLLISLVREHILRPEPVSSSFLSQRTDLKVSSATIRNEMVVLEEKGYLRAPHTSAGRVPTEEGYRFFVKYLIDNQATLEHPGALLRSQFDESSLEVDTWMQTIAMMLAQETQTAVLITEPRMMSENHFKQIQLISIQGRLVLMVMVLTSGYVHQQMLLMKDTVEQLKLSNASEMLNRLAYDKTAATIRELQRNISTILVREIAQLAAEALEQMDELSGRISYQAGLGELLPRLEEQSAQQALRILEGETDLDAIISEVFEQSNSRVRVIVAGEGRWESLSNLSMVLGRYTTGDMQGAIGLVGPTHMRYGTAIPAVGYASEVVSRFLTEARGIESTNPIELSETVDQSDRDD